MLTLQIPEAFIPILFQGLGELPLKIAGPVFTEIQRQLSEHAEQGNGDVQKTT